MSRKIKYYQKREEHKEKKSKKKKKLRIFTPNTKKWLGTIKKGHTS